MYICEVNRTNPLQKKIGIIGGGQLGRMMIEESLRLNIAFNVLDTVGSPCEQLADTYIEGTLTNADAIRKLASISDVVTYEIEHIDIETLLQLEQEGKSVIPAARVLRIIQDKGLQKQFLVDAGIPTAPFRFIHNTSDWLDLLSIWPDETIVAKTRKEGYDGKGVQLCNRAEIANGFIPFQTPAIAEKFIPCEKELSVMVCRDVNGNTDTWPVVEMVFDAKANLVTTLQCPADVSETTAQRAQQVATSAIEKLDSAGVFAVELFLTREGEILVNEIAPRPHNSGHHTIEACYTSQFEQLVRIVAGIPMGNTQLIQPSVMMNLLGSSDFSGPYRLHGLEDAMNIPGVYIHLYGKKESKPMRKMGHVTIIAPTLQEAKEKSAYVKQILTFVPDKDSVL